MTGIRGGSAGGVEARADEQAKMYATYRELSPADTALVRAFAHWLTLDGGLLAALAVSDPPSMMQMLKDKLRHCDTCGRSDAVPPELAARIAALEAALRPFAALTGTLELDGLPDGAYAWTVTVGDLRRARAVLERTTEENK